MRFIDFFLLYNVETCHKEFNINQPAIYVIRFYNKLLHEINIYVTVSEWNTKPTLKGAAD